jgi:hypothetical protein
MAVNTTTTFTAKASADGGTTFSSAAQATVTIGGGGGGGGPIVCQGYNSTIVLELGYLSQSSGLSEGFGPNDALVAHFKTSGAAASTAGKLGQIYAVEFGTGTAPRKGSLSTVPCDFTAGFAEKKCSGSLTAFDGDPGPSFGLTQGTTVAACTADLAPNTDYYFNVNNHPTLGGGCTAASCDMKVNLQKPGGT